MQRIIIHSEKDDGKKGIIQMSIVGFGDLKRLNGELICIATGS